MARKSGSKPSSPRSFPRRGNNKLTSKLCYCEDYVKNNVGRDRRPNVVILQWSVLFVGGRVVRQGRWQGSEVGR